MISIRNVQKSYGSGVTRNEVFQDFDLEIDPDTIVSLVGPTGCGKTTLLNLISKLDTPDSGVITIGDRGAIGYMMQNALLLPWRTLAENALLGTEVMGGWSHERDQLLNSYFESFDLAGYKQSYPDTSSGGMKQRVALIRTLLVKPQILLLDEPFSNLDFDIKLKIQKHLIRYHHINEATILLVTHDIEDAISLSDRVVVLSEPPTRIKADISIELGLTKSDPVDARKSSRFSEYFAQIWDELKYLKDDSHE
jgi:NitT/TauT family transport system ATP-binding protein